MVFVVQKKILLGVGPKCYCKVWFLELNIVLVPFWYIFSLIMFVFIKIWITLQLIRHCMILIFLLLPLALQPTVGFGLLNSVLPFFPICRHLCPSSHSQHLKHDFNSRSRNDLHFP